MRRSRHGSTRAYSTCTAALVTKDRAWVNNILLRASSAGHALLVCCTMWSRGRVLVALVVLALYPCVCVSLEPSSGCAFSPEATEAIRKWLVAPEANPLDPALMRCAAAGAGKAVGTAVGAMGGAWVGQTLMGDESESGWGGVVTAGLALLGGYLGHRVGDAVASGMIELFLNRPPSAIEADCLRRLEVAPDATVRDIQRAYRKAALRHHPDKGGSQEELVKDTFCKELLVGKAEGRARGGGARQQRGGGQHGSTNGSPEDGPPGGAREGSAGGDGGGSAGGEGGSNKGGDGGGGKGGDGAGSSGQRRRRARSRRARNNPSSKRRQRGSHQGL